MLGTIPLLGRRLRLHHVVQVLLMLLLGSLSTPVLTRHVVVIPALQFGFLLENSRFGHPRDALTYSLSFGVQLSHTGSRLASGICPSQYLCCLYQ
eukprot:6491993-Amphidinium_carterae.1